MALKSIGFVGGISSLGTTESSLSFRRSICTVNFSNNNFNTHHLPLTRLKVCTAAVKRNPKRLKYAGPRFNKDDGFVYVEADPSGSDTWKLEPVIELLKQGAVGVVPTDTVYAIVCDLRNHSAIERLRRIKDIGNSKARNNTGYPLSVLCQSFREIDTYTLGFPRGTGQGQTNIFRVVKHCLPGPYTFILPASKNLPKQCSRYGTTTAKYTTRKNVGVRMPNDAICQAILNKLEAPLISTSAKWPNEDDWMIDPVLIADIYEPEGLDFVVDGGVRVSEPSTVVDTTRDPPTILRQGKGPKQDWMVVKDNEDSARSDKETLETLRTRAA
ncbi:hypothetical protein IFM89_001956 [Coptis chinensis]|uniref:Threonylcarbamoyl-AMP synthase n=1 Tax=Coptis chinensis TaxID=261450 RepID=A0A835HNE5_9MAGN|nr:hypothetical protein IFM89_001956 [Coptis chinensis]